MKKIGLLLILIIPIYTIYDMVFLKPLIGAINCEYNVDKKYFCQIIEEAITRKKITEKIYTGITEIKIFSKKSGRCGPEYTLKLADKENNEYTLKHTHYGKTDFEPLNNLFKGEQNFIYYSKSNKINIIFLSVEVFLCLLVILLIIREMKYKDIDIMSTMSDEELEQLKSTSFSNYKNIKEEIKNSKQNYNGEK
ncbi:MAG: hypothetical protein J5594_00540 [Elusimicrobiaceae bacterium]|nr:hypothetical protein [Elusimicrobiaceae bacterium]